jgi:hypothetical protein
MNIDDLRIAAGPSASKAPCAVTQPWTTRHPIGGLGQPTDPLRVPLVTAFCTCGIDAPTLSYMPRLPK